MSIISAIIVLVIVGFIVAILNHPKIAIDSFFKFIINGMIAICVLIWLLQVFGVIDGSHFRIKL